MSYYFQTGNVVLFCFISDGKKNFFIISYCTLYSIDHLFYRSAWIALLINNECILKSSINEVQILHSLILCTKMYTVD